MKLLAIDLFAGVGGLTEGMHQAGFDTKMAFEIDSLASKAYKLNHEGTEVVTKDIRKVDLQEIRDKLNGETIHLLAGCPPCQGFSSMRRLNRKQEVFDERNDLINEYVRFVMELRPYTFMMENVPALEKYDLFLAALETFKGAGYKVDYKVVNVKDYGVPQSRKRLVLVGSRLGDIKVAGPVEGKVTVKDVIGDLPLPGNSSDPLHSVFPKHTPQIQSLIQDIPKNGGSRKDLGPERQLKCHQRPSVGFNDVYGRLRWNEYSTTITGGCLNPSKGRFLHPEQDRCISAREAALLQSFPSNYKFPLDAPKTNIALMIGNALPPEFSRIQSAQLRNHIDLYLG
ncbi:DNA cytosine methyltransferase [Algoriphagus sp. H41]|uniref:DNA (cytosine-5-)-methyltransferase n=1 Tax=Algoriphagus oliviformis TaxID=2811231 RepID=A0ABS3CA79_9BACT|nr:DNA cytosine methyltransferase [Algoriphagus oliviformis]MBN7813085.1 DNA cytosine methyltransferase [Algoriphagus oliviformis]